MKEGGKQRPTEEGETQVEMEEASDCSIDRVGEMQSCSIYP